MPLITPGSTWERVQQKKPCQVLGTSVEPVSGSVYVLYTDVTNTNLQSDLIAVKREAGLPQAQFGLCWREKDCFLIQWHITYNDNPILDAIAIFAEDLDSWNRNCVAL
ncbi:hypothetical protein FD723_40530 (plasmid) [Nostoc sp. C052]|uniref:hypothetical protein n=1 Tax=Nostoc sp. C052 TaxID=2576902 RepID=UPI0015C3FE3A|nr:hypothetical protein [Nostoc sp. C052]QLE46501.1 hypothetical protein FD723_40530 [Nostoc sp. C052]